MNRVLIVDDQEDSLYLLSALLQGHGYSVETARNGADALAKARKCLPNLVISDLLMPVMDGYTLLRHWRADEQLWRIPFVVYTATYIDPKDEQLALDLGANAFIVKPAEPEPFMDRIEEVLTRHKTNALAPSVRTDLTEQVLVTQYNEALIRKLEAKMQQLEHANRALQEDIAARIEAEEALRKLSAAVEQSPVAVVISDRDGLIEYVNPQFSRMTGYPLEELYGRNLRLLKSGETPLETYQDLWNTITAGGQWRGEFHNRKKDGTLYWDQSAISPIRDASGAITHFLAVKEDITAQKVLEAQLVQAQKMEAVGRLAGGIAHDFNNMLSVILGYTEAALSELKPMDPLYKDLEEVRSAARRSAELTRQLLTFSRRQTIAPIVLDLNAQLNGMQGLLRRLIGEDVVIEFDVCPDVWPVKVDPSQIDQIVANLAVNARDAMPNGGQLTIETRNVSLDEAYCQEHADFPPGDYVMIAVSDTGCGMDSATLAHVFEPFFTTKGEGKGTGLGLATVYGVVKQNRGSVNIYSEPNHGTTFRVYLPRYVGEESATAAAAQETIIGRGHETILLVEDEGMLRSLGKRLLERLGYSVLEAAGPGDAITLCERYPGEIHLLLTDLIMPVMNGKELTERVRALRPAVKVLYMSGYTADIIGHHGMLERGTNFIEKPFTLTKIGIIVRRILDEAV